LGRIRDPFTYFDRVRHVVEDEIDFHAVRHR
jgi:hypothetical protein